MVLGLIHLKSSGGGGGLETKKKNGWGGVRGKNKMHGGRRRPEK